MNVHDSLISAIHTVISKHSSPAERSKVRVMLDRYDENEVVVCLGFALIDNDELVDELNELTYRPGHPYGDLKVAPCRDVHYS